MHQETGRKPGGFEKNEKKALGHTPLFRLERLNARRCWNQKGEEKAAGSRRCGGSQQFCSIRNDLMVGCAYSSAIALAASMAVAWAAGGQSS